MGRCWVGCIARVCRRPGKRPSVGQRGRNRTSRSRSSDVTSSPKRIRGSGPLINVQVAYYRVTDDTYRMLSSRSFRNRRPSRSIRSGRTAYSFLICPFAKYFKRLTSFSLNRCARVLSGSRSATPRSWIATAGGRRRSAPTRPLVRTLEDHDPRLAVAALDHLGDVAERLPVTLLELDAGPVVAQ